MPPHISHGKTLASISRKGLLEYIRTFGSSTCGYGYSPPLVTLIRADNRLKMCLLFLFFGRNRRNISFLIVASAMFVEHVYQLLQRWNSGREISEFWYWSLYLSVDPCIMRCSMSCGTRKEERVPRNLWNSVRKMLMPARSKSPKWTYWLGMVCSHILRSDDCG